MDTKEKEELISMLKQLMSPTSNDALSNSWERVEELRAELTTDTNKYPWRESAEVLWQAVSYAQYDDECGINRSDKITRTPLESLNDCLERPRFPPIEVLSAINEAFQIYMLAGGKLELEDVFFGPRKRGVGNYSARCRKEADYSHFDFYVRVGGDLRLMSDEEAYRAHQKKSLEDKAEEYLAYGMNPHRAKRLGVQANCESGIDPESYLRGYRRWKRTPKE
ncbi:hypothetical protein L4D76_01605 [Photobacterium sagamiensis]|uniref:hypothetical protein n=1 Tax=Photobacterium sagamiensis TaxID=2910241 RepID=UPI003D12235E